MYFCKINFAYSTVSGLGNTMNRDFCNSWNWLAIRFMSEFPFQTVLAVELFIKFLGCS